MPPRREEKTLQTLSLSLFKALTRLFSGPIINYRSQSGRRIQKTTS